MAAKSVIYGTSKTYTLTVKRNNVVIDITGWTFYFNVKRNLSQLDTEAAISKVVTNHTDPTHGVTKIVLSPTDTDISPGTYFYDITYKDTSNNVEKIDVDKFTILPSATKTTL